MCTGTHICSLFLFFNDTATTEIYTLSYTTLFRSDVGTSPDDMAVLAARTPYVFCRPPQAGGSGDSSTHTDRKSTRLNSSHTVISYAVFCLKKKKTHH